MVWWIRNRRCDAVCVSGWKWIIRAGFASWRRKIYETCALLELWKILPYSFLTSSEVYFTESPPLVATAGVTSVLSLCSVATPVPLYAFTVPFPSGVWDRLEAKAEKWTAVPCIQPKNDTNPPLQCSCSGSGAWAKAPAGRISSH